MRGGMSVSIRDATRHLFGTRLVALPVQQTFWGWVRAALAFQPAHPLPSEMKFSRDLEPAAAREVGDSSTALEAAAQLGQLRRNILLVPAEKRLAARVSPKVTQAVVGAGLAAAADGIVLLASEFVGAVDPVALNFESALSCAGRLTQILITAEGRPGFKGQYVGADAPVLARDLSELVQDLRDSDLDARHDFSLLVRIGLILNRALELGLIEDDEVLEYAKVLANATYLFLAFISAHSPGARTRLAARPLDATLELARARDGAKSLAREDVLPGRVARDLDHGLSHALALVRKLDNPATRSESDVAHAVGVVADLSRAFNEVTHLLVLSARNKAYRYELDAMRSLGLDPHRSQGLGEVLLAGVLDDFTTADLTSVDLSTVALEGILWSEWGTRWPLSFDVDRLKTISRELEADSGVYRVERAAPVAKDAPVPI